MITIAPIVSAVGMLISTIVLAVTGGSSRCCRRRELGLCAKTAERLGKFLKYLAGQAGEAFYGIIGTAVSFFFRVAARVATFVGQHLYMGVAGAVAVTSGRQKHRQGFRVEYLHRNT